MVEHPRAGNTPPSGDIPTRVSRQAEFSAVIRTKLTEGYLTEARQAAQQVVAFAQPRIFPEQPERGDPLIQSAPLHQAWRAELTQVVDPFLSEPTDPSRVARVAALGSNFPETLVTPQFSATIGAIGNVLYQHNIVIPGLMVAADSSSQQAGRYYQQELTFAAELIRTAQAIIDDTPGTLAIPELKATDLTDGRPETPGIPAESASEAIASLHVLDVANLFASDAQPLTDSQQQRIALQQALRDTLAQTALYYGVANVNELLNQSATALAVVGNQDPQDFALIDAIAPLQTRSAAIEDVLYGSEREAYQYQIDATVEKASKAITDVPATDSAKQDSIREALSILSGQRQLERRLDVYRTGLLLHPIQVRAATMVHSLLVAANVRDQVSRTEPPTYQELIATIQADFPTVVARMATYFQGSATDTTRYNPTITKRAECFGIPTQEVRNGQIHTRSNDEMIADLQRAENRVLLTLAAELRLTLTDPNNLDLVRQDVTTALQDMATAIAQKPAVHAMDVITRIMQQGNDGEPEGSRRPQN